MHTHQRHRCDITHGRSDACVCGKGTVNTISSHTDSVGAKKSARGGPGTEDAQ